MDEIIPRMYGIGFALIFSILCISSIIRGIPSPENILLASITIILNITVLSAIKLIYDRKTQTSKRL